MTEPLLNYQSASPVARSGLLTAAWIYLLVLGILYFLVGTCGSASIIFLIFAAPRGLRFNVTVLWVFAIVFFLLTWGSAATFLGTAFLLRRLSRVAAIIAMVLALVNAGLAFSYDVFSLIVFLRPGRTMPAGTAIGSLVLYLLATLANLGAAILLFYVLRQMRRARATESPPQAGTAAASPAASTQESP